MPKTIAVSNEKGGVAKTTTALSLGAALAELGNRTLLIDLDAQANLTLALGLEPGESELTSSNIMLDNEPLLNARRKTEIENLDLIPSSSRIETSEQFLPVRTNYTTILQRAIQSAPPCLTNTSSWIARPRLGPSPATRSPPQTCCSFPPRPNTSPPTRSAT